MDQALDLTTCTETSFGTVSYERSLEVVEIRGYVEAAERFIYVYGNPDLPRVQQAHTAVPLGRVLEIEYVPSGA